MRLKSAGILYFDSNLWRNKPQIARGPIKGRFMFLFKFVKYAPQIDRRPIRGRSMFLIVICLKISSKSAGGGLKGVLCFWFKFVKMRPESAEGRLKEFLCF